MLLTILMPGLGHFYLALWRRALLWFAVYFTAATFLLPDESVPDSFTADAFVEASEAVPLWVTALILGISVLCLFDAYLMAGRRNQQVRRTEERTVVCPNCGKDIDEDIDFCHWCTTRLDDTEKQ